MLRDLLHVPVRIGRVRKTVQERLQVREEGAGDFLHLALVKRRFALLAEDGVEDGGLPVEEGLAKGGWLACEKKKEGEKKISTSSTLYFLALNFQFTSTYHVLSPCPAQAP